MQFLSHPAQRVLIFSCCMAANKKSVPKGPVAEPCWTQVCLAVFGFGHRRPIPDPTPFAEEQPNRWVRGGSPPVGTLLRISPILRHSASRVRIVASLDRTRLGAASVRKRKCAQRRNAPLGLIKATESKTCTDAEKTLSTAYQRLTCGLARPEAESCFPLGYILQSANRLHSLSRQKIDIDILPSPQALGTWLKLLLRCGP